MRLKRRNQCIKTHIDDHVCVVNHLTAFSEVRQLRSLKGGRNEPVRLGMKCKGH